MDFLIVFSMSAVKPQIRLGWSRFLFHCCLNLLSCMSVLLVVEMSVCPSGLAYTLGNLYRDQFVIPKSEVTSILLASFYLQFAELKNKYVSICYVCVDVDRVVRLVTSSSDRMITGPYICVSTTIFYTVFQKNDAKIQITITTAYLIRIKYPLSGFNYHLSDVNVANFNKIHRIVSEQ